MPVTLNDVLTIVAPLYVLMLDLWRRQFMEKSNTASQERVDKVEEGLEEKVEEEVEEVEDGLRDHIDTRMDDVEEKIDTDFSRMVAMMDELHDDARVIHDNVIEHNPCAPDCPLCELNKDTQTPEADS